MAMAAVNKIMFCNNGATHCEPDLCIKYSNYKVIMMHLILVSVFMGNLASLLLVFSIFASLDGS